MSDQDIFYGEKLLRELDSDLRAAMDDLAGARSHEYQSSINFANSRGKMYGDMSTDGRQDRNKARREQFENAYTEARSKTQAAEARVKELSEKKASLKKELGLP